MSDDDDSEEIPKKKKKKKSMTARETYNTVSDTVTGANVRWQDNLFQAVGILVFVIIGAPVGFLLGGGVGVLVGVLAGLVVGFLITGTILMIYRAVKHARGEHD